MLPHLFWRIVIDRNCSAPGHVQDRVRASKVWFCPADTSQYSTPYPFNAEGLALSYYVPALNYLASSWTAGHEPARALGGTGGGYWESDPTVEVGHAWIGVEFESPVAVEFVRLESGGDLLEEYAYSGPGAVRLEWSDDGVAWHPAPGGRWEKAGPWDSEVGEDFWYVLGRGDLEYDGQCWWVGGRVTVNGAPAAQYVVRAFDGEDGRLVDEVAAMHGDGTYAVRLPAEVPHYIVAMGSDQSFEMQSAARLAIPPDAGVGGFVWTPPSGLAFDIELACAGGGAGPSPLPAAGVRFLRLRPVPGWEVRHADGRRLAAAGERVRWSQYWLRRIAEGVVELLPLDGEQPE